MAAGLIGVFLDIFSATLVAPEDNVPVVSRFAVPKQLELAPDDATPGHTPVMSRNVVRVVAAVYLPC